MLHSASARGRFRRLPVFSRNPPMSESQPGLSARRHAGFSRLQAASPPLPKTHLTPQPPPPETVAQSPSESAPKTPPAAVHDPPAQSPHTRHNPSSKENPAAAPFPDCRGAFALVCFHSGERQN